MNLFAFINKQMRWSANTFGRTPRLKGILEHIRKEVQEIEEKPSDISEWADVIILAIDGAWRQGFTAHQICQALEEKQLKNFSRVWNVQGDDQPCEHIEQAESGGP
jgi:hypothetical protein